MGGASKSQALILYTGPQEDVEVKAYNEEAVDAASEELSEFNKMESQLAKAKSDLHEKLMKTKQRLFSDPEVLELRKEIDDLEAEIRSGNSEVDQLRRALNNLINPPKIVDEEEEIQIEIEVEDDVDDTVASAGEEPTLDQEEEIEEEEPTTLQSANRNLRRKCKSVYLKIANITHPDKTSSARLHELFLAAGAAYKRFDLGALENLLKIARGGSDSIVQDLKRKIKDVMAKINSLVNDIHHMKTSGLAHLVELESLYGTAVAIAKVKRDLKSDVATLNRAVEEQTQLLKSLDTRLKDLKDPEQSRRRKLYAQAAAARKRNGI